MAAGPSQRRRSRKQDILDVFAEQVAARGYDAVSIRDIAETMGVSKGTIIHHYGSKDRLLEQLHASYMQRRLAEAQLILDELSTPVEQLSGLVFHNLYAMQLDRDATVAFAREIVRFASEPVMDDVRQMRREYAGLMREILARGMESGDFRREDPTMLSLQIFGMFNWSWTWMRAEGSWTIEELGASFIRTIMSGIAEVDDASEAATSARVTDAVRSAISQVASSRNGT